MKQYIDKSALVAEIERQKIGYNTDGKHSVEYNTVKKILDILDTLEVKEVDLEKELKILDNTLFDLDGVAVQGATHYLTVEDVKDIAKHFFELGLNSQSNIGFQNIDDLFEEEGEDPYSKEAKLFKECYYRALDRVIENFKPPKGE